MMQCSKPRAPKIKSQCIRIRIHPSTWQLAVLCRVTPSCGVLIDAVHFLLCTARDLDDASTHANGRTLCQDCRPSNYCAICQPQANLSQIRLVDAASLSANKTDDSASCLLCRY